MKKPFKFLPTIYVDQDTGEILKEFDKNKFQIIEHKPHYKEYEEYIQKQNYAYCKQRGAIQTEFKFF